MAAGVCGFTLPEMENGPLLDKSGQVFERKKQDAVAA